MDRIPCRNYQSSRRRENGKGERKGKGKGKGKGKVRGGYSIPASGLASEGDIGWDIEWDMG